MKISIITVCRNNVSGLEKTILSVTGQTASLGIDYEYIVIDGDSDDGTKELLSRYSDKISYWVSELDTGIYNAMNKGVEASNSEYCLFLNSSDTLFNDSVILDVIPLLDGSDIVCGNMRTSDNTIMRSPVARPNCQYFINRCSLPHEASFIKRSLLLACPYDESYRIISDWRFFFQAIVMNRCSYKQISLLITIFDLTGISSTKHELLDAEHERANKELFPDWLVDDTISSKAEVPVIHRFFDEVKDRRISKLLYGIDLLIVKVMSVFMKNQGWIKNYHLRDK